MLELLLISTCAAFLLTLVEPVTDMLYIFIGGKTANAIFAVGFSSLGTWLAGVTDAKTFILYVLAASFAGPALLEIVRYAASYKAVRTRVTE